MLTGDNGILTQANNAKKETEVKGLKEEVNLMMIVLLILAGISKI